MIELRKIDKKKYAEFEKIMNNKKKKMLAGEVMSVLHICEGTYNLFLSHYFYNKDKRTRTKKPLIKPVNKIVKIERQNIPDGFLPWISRILGVA